MGSAALWLLDALHRLPWIGGHGETSILGGGVLLALFCWSTIRGGWVGGAFFVVIYVSLFLTCLTGRINDLCDWMFPAASSVRFHISFAGPGESLRTALPSVAADAWVVFSVWVLLCSKSARFYRKTRREEVTAKEEGAFEWPPARRL